MVRLLVLVLLFSIPAILTAQAIDNLPVIQNEQQFKEVTKIFDKRFDRYHDQKVKIKSSFTDSIFAAQQWAKKNGSQKQRLDADFQVFFAYNQLINNDSILATGNQLLNDEKFLEFPESVYVAEEVSSTYGRKGFYRKQLETFPLIKSLQEIHGIEDPEKYDSDLALIYYNIGDYANARESFKKQAGFFLENNDLFRAASMYNNIALTYEKESNDSLALINYRKSLDFLEQDDAEDQFFNKAYRVHFKNVVTSNIASLNLKKGKLDGVEKAFKTELESAKEVQEPRIVLQGYLNLVELYLFQNDVERVQESLDSAYSYLKLYKSPSLKADALSLEGKYLLVMGRAKESQNLFLQASFITDSIQRALTLNNFEEASLEYDLRTTQIELQDSQKLLDQTSKTNLLLWIITAITLIAILIFVIQYRKINKNNRSIKQQERKLIKALKAREIMLEEVHHRIKNNLQIISGLLELKAAGMDNDRSRSALAEAREYINSMKFLQLHLYGTTSKKGVNLQKFIEDIATSVLSYFKNKKISYLIKCSDMRLKEEQLVSLGLIVCELITNSAKHAFDDHGEIHISIEMTENKYLFEYRDNGTPIKNQKTHQGSGMGLNLIEMLLEDMDATVIKREHSSYDLKFYFNN